MKSERSASEVERIWEDIGPAQYSTRRSLNPSFKPEGQSTVSHESSKEFWYTYQNISRLEAEQRNWYAKEPQPAAPLVTDLQALAPDDVAKPKRQKKDRKPLQTGGYKIPSSVQIEFPGKGTPNTRNSIRHSYALNQSEQHSDLLAKVSNLSVPTRRLFECPTKVPHVMPDSEAGKSQSKDNKDSPFDMKRPAIVPFPQTTLCTTIDPPFSKDSKCIQKVTNFLESEDACLKVPLPSGYTLRVPPAALRMYDYGVPDFSQVDPAVTPEDVRSRIQKETGLLLGKDLATCSLLELAEKNAEGLSDRSEHEPRTVGEVIATEFAYATMDDRPISPKIFKKIDPNEFVQRESEKPNETYGSLRSCVQEMERPLADRFASVQHEEPVKMGNAHDAVRQYLKDHGLDATGKILAQEWWLKHRSTGDSTKNPQVDAEIDELGRLARHYSLLEKEYQHLDQKAKKAAKLANRRQGDVQFLAISLRRCVAKTQQLEKELEEAKAFIPDDYEKSMRERKVMEDKYNRIRRLCHQLHSDLNVKKENLKQLQEKAALPPKVARQRKMSDNDAKFPEYQGTNPYSVMTRRKPVQMMKPNGMSVTQKVAAHNGSVLDVACNPLAQSAVSVGADGKWFVWNTDSKPAPTFHGGGHSGAIGRCEFSPNGLCFVTGGLNSVVNMWDTEGRHTLEMRHKGPVTALSFHSSGDFLLTGMSNGMINLWDLKGNRCRTNFCKWQKGHVGHSGAVASCQVLPFSNAALTAGDDGTARLWDLRTESVQTAVKQDLPFRKAQIAANGLVMATTAKYTYEITLWDLRKLGTQICVGNYSPNTVSTFALETSCHMAAVGLDNGSISFWDLGSGGNTVYPAHAAMVTAVTWDIWSEKMLTGDEQGNLFFWS